MSRSTMATLITLVRTRIADVAGASQVFSDDDLQAFLDQRRSEVRFMPLRPAPTFSPTGITYLDFYAGSVGAFEDRTDFVLQDASYNDISSLISIFEPLVGHVKLSTQPAGMAVWATGHAYDVAAACGDACTAWASKVALQFDFTGPDQGFRRSQQAQALLAQAQAFYCQALPAQGHLYQGDAAPEFTGSGVTYPVLGPGAWG